MFIIFTREKPAYVTPEAPGLFHRERKGPDIIVSDIIVSDIVVPHIVGHGLRGAGMVLRDRLVFGSSWLFFPERVEAHNICAIRFFFGGAIFVI